jgi:hypothetical protein
VVGVEAVPDHRWAVQYTQGSNSPDKTGVPLQESDFTVPAGKTYKTLIIAAVRPVQHNLTVPANVGLRFEDGGALDVPTGVNLSIAGSI